MSGSVWIKKRFAFGASSAASTTGTAVTLYTTKGNVIITRVVLNRITDYAGGAVSAAAVIVGVTGGTTNKYLTSTDIFTGVSNGWTNAVVGTTAGAEVAGKVIAAVVSTTTANTDALTAGELEIWLQVSGLGV